MKQSFQFYWFLLLSVVSHVKSQCTISLRTDLNHSTVMKEPLFLKFTGTEYKFMIPKGQNLEWKKNETALIACTTDKKENFLEFNQQKSSTIICDHDKTFKINSKLYTVDQFNECNSQIYGNVINQNTACGGDGILLNIGFQLSDGNNFVNFIDVCYNKAKASAIYTKHVVYGQAIKYAMKGDSRPSTFKTTEVPAKISPATAYTKAAQLKRFETILGSESAAQKYITDKSFLARGHLACDADGVFDSWQSATYYYVNVCPQWQGINNGNWKAVEFAVRAKAADLKREVIVYTGAHDVLKLENKNISLVPEGIFVPKWSWKILKDPQSNSGIAFLTLNNPFITSNPSMLCTDVCAQYNWSITNSKVFDKGYTVCCEVPDLMNKIAAIPKEARVTNALYK